jgi:hypothetical protein
VSHGAEGVMGLKILGLAAGMPIPIQNLCDSYGIQAKIFSAVHIGTWNPLFLF